MAHFAELDSNNKVLRVCVISNDDVAANGGEWHADTEAWVKSKWGGVAWKQCSYNANKRGLYPGPDWTYDATNDRFIEPKPHASWTLNGSFVWVAPVTMPTQSQRAYTEGSINHQYWISWNESESRWEAAKDDDADSGMIKYWNPSSSAWVDI